MFDFHYSRRFKKSLSRLQSSGAFSEASARALRHILTTLQAGKRLDSRYRDHSLSGDLAGYCDCHIRGDLVMIYAIDTDEHIIDLVDIGSHADLFE